MPVYATGYFGIPGRTGNMVHAVNESGRPICGQALHSEARFEWCAPGLNYEMVECSRCKRKAAFMLRWKQVNSYRFERHDGAVVEYNRKHWGPETDENNPNHRGWVAFGPGPQETNYIGFFPKRWRSGGHSKMRVSTKFKTAEKAIQAVEKLFPWPKT